MPKCDFNKVECSPVNLLHIFRTLFLKNTSGRLPLHETNLLNLTELTNRLLSVFIITLQTLFTIKYVVQRAARQC